MQGHYPDKPCYTFGYETAIKPCRVASVDTSGLFSGMTTADPLITTQHDANLVAPKAGLVVEVPAAVQQVLL